MPEDVLNLKCIGKMSSGMNLFIANLDKRVNNAILIQEFSRFGNVLSADVAKDEQGSSKGFGFVNFSSIADGARALQEMDGKRILTREIHVEMANNQETRKCNKDVGKPMRWASEFDNSIRAGSDSDSSSVISSATNYEHYTTNIQDCVKERMRTLFETQRYADVTFYPKDSRATSISAHKAFLAVGSPLFHQMLFGTQGQCEPGVKLEVQISNLSFTAFSNIVKYLYTDEVFFENDTLVMEILDGAVQFGIQSLVDRCKGYFDSIVLTDQNVCSKLQMSFSKKIEALKSRCLEYTQRNTLQVLNSPDFIHFTPTIVRTICKLPSLNLHSEAELFEGIMRWVYSQSPQNKQQFIEPLRKGIRFLTFTVAEFLNVIQKHPQVMSAEEGLKIMMYLNNPSSSPDYQSLPVWCNKSTAKRCSFESTSNRTGNPTSGQNTGPGRLIIPLRSDSEVQHNIQSLTCMVQMKCTDGRHQIYAMTLSFKKPRPGSSLQILIKVHVHPSNFTTSETLNVVWSEEVRVPFTRQILARRGDLVDIEVEAKDIHLYEFLQFDETRNAPGNSHFTCSIGSKPKIGRLYFIREIEYGPQANRLQNNRRFKPHQ